MKIILATFCLFFVWTWLVGQAEKITAFSYETFTRGYRKTIVIRADSTFIKELNQPDKSVKRKTKAEDWANLLQAVAGYKLAALTNLPAPTNNRERDAARYSSITIKTTSNSYNSGYFDGQQPNSKLAKLMAEISQVEEAKP
ncbi:hypothetical protein AAE02nite_27310 [Adhaeribacter aerolatus]|uniref:Uncharacterized protein n=1 Tax=Adhaeribacter aerolatus TaxID=670289 RepID=A0A512AZW2_9BACT|nr:hypothetical protein [Adhaeribacter aerolatus]GEO05067.1 hypothetical protein AAE02nite_27310 [Adhaeribacter aerolatus]